jgi:hypothetical protein
MAAWLKLTLAILAGSAGLLAMFRKAPKNAAELKQTIERDLDGLRGHLFDRKPGPRGRPDTLLSRP